MITLEQALIERIAISISEYCNLTGVSKSTAQRQIKSGLIPSISLNGRRLIPVSFIQQIFEGHIND